MYRIHRTGFGHKDNDSPDKCCSFLDFTPPAMSIVVNHIAYFHVWTIVYIPYGQTFYEVLGLLCSLHVYKEG